MVNNKLSNEELSLWGKWQKQQNNQAGDELVKKYLPLVEYVTERFMISLPKTVDKQEIHSYALEGLLDALNKFNIKKDLKFETYATWRIKGAIIDGLRQSDWLPRSVREKVKKIEKAYVDLEQKYNKSVTDDEVCRYLGITKQELNRALSEAALSAMISIDEVVDDGNEVRKYTSIPDPHGVQPEQVFFEQVTKEALVKAVERLPEKEKLVVSLCYFEELRLTEIAEVLSISVSRVSQLHSKAMLRLHGAIMSVHEYY